MQTRLAPDFRTLFESAPGLFLVLTPELKIAAVSDAYLRATMTQRDVIVGRGLFDVFPDNPDDPAADGVRNLKASLDRVLATRAIDPMAVQKYDIRRPDSEGGGFEVRHWSCANSPVLDATGEIEFIIHKAEDVTELVRLNQKGAEQEKLIEASALLRNVVGSSDDAIITKTLSGIITSWNRGAEKLFGFTAEEAVGKPMQMLIPPDKVTEEPQILARMAHGESIEHFETVRLSKSGELIDISATISPIRNDAGRIIGASQIARDITERKRSQLQLQALVEHQAQLHQELKKAYDDLRQTQQAVTQRERLSALGQMASGIAHDINNAISPVMLYTESLLEKEPNLSPQARRFLETIQRAIDDVAQTVARMREFYRAREPQLTLAPVDVNALIQQVMDLTRARWSDLAHQRGIAIDVKIELAPDLPFVMGAESEIREALTNLVFNALDAMPQGGTLTLRTERTAQSVQLQVTDTGIGMNDETRRRCLEPFFTTKGERGTGLGLAMVYGMLQRHSAGIEIDSAPGCGTTVHLSFGTSNVTDTQASHSLPEAARAPALRILLVDDDPIILQSLNDILGADGHEVTISHGGEAGIEAFRASHGSGRSFDVVITDLGMPHVDGRKVAASIKALSPTVRIIMLTGWGQRLIAEGDIPPHVDQMLSKPPKLREIRETLTALAGIASTTISPAGRRT